MSNETTAKRTRRTFTPEFKAEVVAAVAAGDRTMPEIAAQYDLGQTAIRAWVRQANEGPRPPEWSAEVDSVTVQQTEPEAYAPNQVSEEVSELWRLRQENIQLVRDVSTLKRAIMIFARQAGEGI